MNRGFAAVAMDNPKTAANIGGAMFCSDKDCEDRFAARECAGPRECGL